MDGAGLDLVWSSISGTSPSASLECGSESSAAGLASSSDVLLAGATRGVGRLDSPGAGGPCKLCLLGFAPGPDKEVRDGREAPGGGGGPIEDFVAVGRGFGAVAGGAEARGAPIDGRPVAGVELSCFVGDLEVEGVYIERVSGDVAQDLHKSLPLKTSVVLSLSGPA